ncbi:MAG: GtrA-like protein, partial [Rhizorhabdus sp.]|nr:GtrA-like protein [Rhizorhabdus sp.]
MSRIARLLDASTATGQFVRFALIGLSNTAITTAIAWVLATNGIGLYPSTYIGYAAGTLNGYLLNLRFNFSDQGDRLRIGSFARYIALNVVSALLYGEATHRLAAI